jgi:chromate reductase
MYDGVLFVTPEYNRSMPGVLKNAIDVASRPYGQSAWDGKPCGVVSVSPRASAAGANHHRASRGVSNMPAMPQLTYSAASAASSTAITSLTGDQEIPGGLHQRFQAWVERHAD